MALGDAGTVRSVSRNHRRAIDLGPRTSGTFLFDLHAAAVAQLAGERCVHHRRLHAGARVAFRWQLVWIAIGSKMVADSGNPVVNPNRSLHGLSVCTGESARHVAKPVAAPAFACSGIVARIGGSVVDCRM